MFLTGATIDVGGWGVGTLAVLHPLIYLFDAFSFSNRVPWERGGSLTQSHSDWGRKEMEEFHLVVGSEDVSRKHQHSTEMTRGSLPSSGSCHQSIGNWRASTGKHHWDTLEQLQRDGCRWQLLPLGYSLMWWERPDKFLGLEGPDSLLGKLYAAPNGSSRERERSSAELVVHFYERVSGEY